LLFEASTAQQVGSALFWDITQRTAVICHFKAKENSNTTKYPEMRGSSDQLKNYVHQQIN
jgi:hypothetical protein